ncbi:MAG TPA: DUF1015 domain-containing protein [Acidimicrobiia bacterium]|nr:DUF1015 domain-containing protein [Acidimicrobiia bacterium]
MPQFVPFRGILYQAGQDGADLSSLTAPPYDVIDEERRAQLEDLDPHNAVHLTLPRDDQPGDRYDRAGAMLRAWLDDGTLRLDDAAAFYSYRVEFEDESGASRVMHGVIGALEVEPPDDGDVLPHERTMPKPKSDRLDLLRATRANLEPIWGLTLTPGLTSLLDDEGVPAARCVDTRGARHCLFRVTDPARIEAISAAIAATPLVIADGHHRYETSLRFREEHDRPGPHDFIMCLVVELTNDELVVQPIHRVITHLGDTDLGTLVSDRFDVVELGPNDPETVERAAAAMAERSAMALVDARGVALLVARAEELAPMLADEPSILGGVDATRFEAGLAPAIEQAGGEVAYRHGRQIVAALVRKGEADAAVLLRPVDADLIRQAAEERIRMPQKTTFFHPKPSTGLVIRSLDH